MIAHHIHHALSQVRELQQKILEKQRFRGYSGRARAISGTLALMAAAVMGSSYFPAMVSAHLAGWAIVFILSLFLNFGAILYWFLFDEGSKRNIRSLKPTLDVLPPLFVGGVFTLLFIQNGSYGYLFGTWMCLFGLANLASRHVLPRWIWLLGAYYVVAGILLLFFYHVSFLNPWPMGIVFFAGEWVGGIILHFDGTENASFGEFFSRRQKYHVQT